MRLIKTIILRFSGFSAIGLISTVLSTLLFILMNEILGINGYVSYVTVYVVTILFSYFANAIFVYRTEPHFFACVGFFATYVSGMFVGVALLALFKYLFPATRYFILGFAVLPFTTLWNFVFVNYILTRNSADRRLKRKEIEGHVG